VLRAAGPVGFELLNGRQWVMGRELSSGRGRRALLELEARAGAWANPSEVGEEGEGEVVAAAREVAAREAWGGRCWRVGQPHVLVAVPYNPTMPEALQQSLADILGRLECAHTRCLRCLRCLRCCWRWRWAWERGGGMRGDELTFDPTITIMNNITITITTSALLILAILLILTILLVTTAAAAAFSQVRQPRPEPRVGHRLFAATAGPKRRHGPRPHRHRAQRSAGPLPRAPSPQLRLLARRGPDSGPNKSSVAARAELPPGESGEATPWAGGDGCFKRIACRFGGNPRAWLDRSELRDPIWACYKFVC